MRTFNALATAVTAIAMSLALPAFAQSQAHPKPKDLKVVDDVPPPPRVKEGEPMVEPTVTTRKVGDDTIQEYRVRGRLYQQRIQPASGPAYYLVDDKGEGKFSRVDGPDAKISVPMWVLLEW